MAGRPPRERAAVTAPKRRGQSPNAQPAPLPPPAQPQGAPRRVKGAGAADHGHPHPAARTRRRPQDHRGDGTMTRYQAWYGRGMWAVDYLPAAARELSKLPGTEQKAIDNAVRKLQ